jgi:hypothetical protein
VADAADGLVKAAPVLHKKEEGAIARALEISAPELVEPKR